MIPIGVRHQSSSRYHIKVVIDATSFMLLGHYHVWIAEWHIGRHVQVHVIDTLNRAFNLYREYILLM